MTEKDVSERVDKIIQRSFSICNCPLQVIKDFKRYCEVETRGDYSMGLKILLERNIINFQQEVFAYKMKQLDEQLGELKSLVLSDENKKEEPKSKTFGQKKKEKEVKKDE